MAEDGHVQDEDSAALLGTASVAAIVASIQVASPTWGIAAAAAEPALVAAVQHLQGLQARRHMRVVEVAAETAGVTVDELIQRLTANDQNLVLLANALSAASRTGLETKVAALGRSLGALASDPALVDPEAIWIRILSDIEPAHLRVMLRLQPDQPGSPDEGIFVRRPELLDITGSDELAYAILQTLSSHGLAMLLSGDLCRRGPLTLECIRRLEAAGGGDPMPGQPA